MAVPSIDRQHALGFRQRATFLHQRLPPDHFAEAAFAGLQDSSPRSAVLALHARVEKVSPSAWKDPCFVQVWGPRGAVYVVPKDDAPIFTMGALPRDSVLQAAVETATRRVRKAFQEKRGKDQSLQSLRDLRRASIGGTVRIEWDGSRTKWWLVDRPRIDPESARLELARRFLRSLGPATSKEFSWWSNTSPRDAQDTFQLLGKELVEVILEGRKSCILKTDLHHLEDARQTFTVRLLPPGDPYLAIPDRGMLAPNKALRSQLWPKSVWPGALLVNGEIVGTWRRRVGQVIAHPWKRLGSNIMAAVEQEVVTMPIESRNKGISWVDVEGPAFG